MLQAPEALPVATDLIGKYVRAERGLASGLRTAEQQRIAMKVFALMLHHLKEVVYLSNYGVAGPRGWVRPAPPFLIARLLGIGPSDSSDLRGWAGH